MSTRKMWRCTVCGFIHEGDRPPENCPVCGVPASEFEEISPPQKTVHPAASSSQPKAWRCVVCGYIHPGDSPPDECPVCGAAANDFEEVQTAGKTPEAAGSKSTRIIIIGGGIAGLSAAESARETSPDAEITLICAEEPPPYYRLNLTRFLAGEVGADTLPIHPMDWYDDRRIKIRTGLRLHKVNAAAHTIELHDGTMSSYDKLILATGAQPFVPPVPGHDLPHVFTLRTLDDAKAILEAVKPSAHIICIGGGILGLETAGALARSGAKVTVLEAFDHLMPRQLNAAGSDVLAEHLYSLGIDVITLAKTQRIETKTVGLTDGSELPADTVILTVGVRANLGAIADAGLPVNTGVLVDNFMRTSNPDILAAGDVCEHDGVMYGSWSAAQYQGSIAGMNAAGKATEFGGIPRSHMLKILGKDMFSIGTIGSADGSFTEIEDHLGGNYRMFTMQDGVLAGALLIGDLSLMPAVRKAMENRIYLGSPESAEMVAKALTGS